jgi:hypothetical protein
MEPILLRGDLDMYHKVKVTEMAKIEDHLLDEFSVTEMDLLQVHALMSMESDHTTKKFQDDLREMLDSADSVNLGVDARLELWRAVDAGDRIGPVMTFKDENGTVLLSLATLGSLLELLWKVFSERYEFCVQSFTQYSRELFKQCQAGNAGARER